MRADANDAVLRRQMRELSGTASPRLRAYARTLQTHAARLATLHECLRVASDGRLYEALVGETNRVVRALLRDAQQVGRKPALRRLPFGADASSRRTATALRPTTPLPRRRKHPRRAAAAAHALHEMHARVATPRTPHPQPPQRRD